MRLGEDAGHTARATLDASAFSFGYVHAHDAGAVEDDAAATGDDALDGFAGFGMLREGLVFHFLHHLEALGFLAFFLGKGFVNISGHIVFVGGIVRPARGGRKVWPWELACPAKSFGHSDRPVGAVVWRLWLDSSVGRATD